MSHVLKERRGQQIGHNMACQSVSPYRLLHTAGSDRRGCLKLKRIATGVCYEQSATGVRAVGWRKVDLEGKEPDYEIV